MSKITLTFLFTSCLFLTGCAKFFEVFVSDSATRLAYQIRDEAAALRRSGETKRIFEHRPAAWPDGLTGDYRIEFNGPDTPGEGRRGLFTAKTYDGPTWSSTTYHLNFVSVPTNLKAAHRKGEPTLVTLELRNGQVLLTGLQ